ncbi:MAG: hypothetical protein AAFW67_00820 [Cyanobacteria bacterium J06638_38]
MNPMNPNEDFYEYPVAKLQKINILSQRIETINSLLNVFASNEERVQPLANDCEAIADWLFSDFEQTLGALLQLIEIEDGIE